MKKLIFIICLLASTFALMAEEKTIYTLSYTGWNPEISFEVDNNEFTSSYVMEGIDYSYIHSYSNHFLFTSGLSIEGLRGDVTPKALENYESKSDFYGISFFGRVGIGGAFLSSYHNLLALTFTTGINYSYASGTIKTSTCKIDIQDHNFTIPYGISFMGAHRFGNTALGVFYSIDLFNRIHIKDIIVIDDDIETYRPSDSGIDSLASGRIGFSFNF